MPVIELGAGLLGLSVHGPCVDENGDESSWWCGCWKDGGRWVGDGERLMPRASVSGVLSNCCTVVFARCGGGVRGAVLTAFVVRLWQM